MPHILHIIEYLDKGGATRAALATAKQSARFGPYEHSIVSLKPAHPEAIELAKDAGVTVFETPSISTLDSLIDDSDVVQVEYWNGPAVNHFLHTSLPPCRLAIWFHVVGTSSPQRVHQKLIDLADMPMASAPTTFNDHPVFQKAIESQRTPEPVMVIGPADFDRVKNIELKPHDGFNIGYIGTLSFVKLHPEFIPMSVNIEIPNSKFIVCGQGNEEELKQQASSFNALERFDFRGFVDDIQPVLETFDVYGYPLCEDTYAAAELNLQEVMYAGIPPIVFPHGGIKGLIQHNRTGLFVENIEDYRRAIEYLYYNPVERKRLGVNAAAYARAHFGSKNAARAMNKVYEKLLDLPKQYHAWGESAQKFAPKLSHKKPSNKPGAEIFIESLGSHNPEFRRSMNETDIEQQLLADLSIATTSFQIFNTGVYRYMLHTPSDPYLSMWAGLYLEHNERYAEALSAYAAAISANLKDWRVQWYLARTLNKLGKHDEAKRVYHTLRHSVPSFDDLTKDTSYASSTSELFSIESEPTSVAKLEIPRPGESNTIRVTALVSTYNAESFMSGCLESLVSQTLFEQGELEIVVVDAHSEENEKEIVERFQAAHDNITYIRTEERETLYASWNRGIQIARGTYITSANTDDRHRKDALEKLANYLDDYPDIALTYPGQIDTSAPNESFESTTSTKILDWPVYSYQELERHCIIGSQPMWRRSLHETYGLFRDTFKSAGDYEFWLRVGKEEAFFRYPEVLGLYYRNPKGIEHGSDTSKREALQIWTEYGMFERGIPVILNGQIVTSPNILDKAPSTSQAKEKKTVVSSSPLSFDTYINHFEDQLVKQEHQHALEVAQKAVQQYPDLPYAYILKAIALRQLEDFPNALITLEQSITLEETPEALVELVQLSISTANFEEAYRTQIYIKENYPEWIQRLDEVNIPVPTDNIAQEAISQEEPEEETQETDDIIELINTAPSDETITLQLNTSAQSHPLSVPAGLQDLDYTVKSFGELRAEFEKLIKLQDVKHAEELALAATRKFPDNSEAWILKATSYRLKGSYEEAKEALQQSLLIKDTPEALIELLELSISLGDEQEVLQISEAIKQSYPEYEDYITELLEKKTTIKPQRVVTLHPAIRNFVPLKRAQKDLLQDDSVCIVSFPGSGSSWLSTLLADIVQQTKGYTTSRGKLTVPPSQIVYDLHQDHEASNWLIKQGYTFRLFKTFDIAGVSNQKIVYLFRDPIESLLSAFHYCNQVPYLKYLASSSCDSFCLSNIENYNLHLNAAVMLKEAYPDRVLILNTKNVNEQHTTSLEVVHNFLSIPYDPVIASKAQRNCDMEQYLMDTTLDTPLSYSSPNYLQPGNELSRLTLDGIVSTLMPVYQEACSVAGKFERTSVRAERHPVLTLSQPV